MTDKARIDISSWNGWDTEKKKTVLDWDKAAPLVDFVICKALEYNKDLCFDSFWASLATRIASKEIAGRGAYYFWRGDHDPVTKAQQFVDIVQPGANDSLVIDLEEEDSTYTLVNAHGSGIWKSINAWLKEVNRLTNKTPAIYTTKYWWEKFVCSIDKNFKYVAPTETSQYPLWLAAYPNVWPNPNYKPILPAGWKIWDMWQYSSAGSVSGIDGKVDMNNISMPLSDLIKKWSGGTGTLPEVPVIEEPVSGNPKYQFKANIYVLRIHASSLNASSTVGYLTRDSAGVSPVFEVAEQSKETSTGITWGKIPSGWVSLNVCELVK